MWKPPLWKPLFSTEKRIPLGADPQTLKLRAASNFGECNHIHSRLNELIDLNISPLKRIPNNGTRVGLETARPRARSRAINASERPGATGNVRRPGCLRLRLGQETGWASRTPGTDAVI